MTTEWKEEQYDLLFGVRRSVRYHARRVLHYDRLHNFSTAASVVFGSATVLTAIGQFGQWAIAGAAAAVAILSALDLVFGYSRKARLHSDLSRRFIDLEARIVRAHAGDSFDDELLAEFTADRLTIEKDEPPVLRTLDVLCHNELLLALGHGDEYFVPVSLFRRAFAQWFDVGADAARRPAKTSVDEG